MSATKLEPKARPTNLDIQAQVAELHVCQHETRSVADQSLNEVKELRHDVRGQMSALNGAHHDLTNQLAHLGGKLDGMRLTQNAVASQIGAAHNDEEGKPIRARFGGLKLWQAIAALFSAATGAQVAYRIGEPAVVAAFLAAHHALLGR